MRTVSGVLGFGGGGGGWGDQQKLSLDYWCELQVIVILSKIPKCISCSILTALVIHLGLSDELLNAITKQNSSENKT